MMRFITRKRLLKTLGMLAFEVVLGACGTHHDRNKLWKIVNGQCARTPDHKPCAVYDPDQGYALLKDLYGHGQYLLIPTQHIAGVESPKLLDATTPNYFALAWNARARVSAGYGFPVPDRDMSLAINSRWGRSQDQLHIHIDCMSPYVRKELDKNWIGPDWTLVSLKGHPYRARVISSLDPSPFQLLHADDMSIHTLFITVAPQGGFLLLDDAAHGLDRASGEELQDHKCLIADPAQQNGMSLEMPSGMGTM